MAGLTQLNLSQFDVTAAAAPAAELPPCVLTIKRTRSGEQILLCTESPAPDYALQQADEQGLPLFTLAEIPHLTDCPAAVLERIISVKRTFPGASVVQLLQEVATA